LAAQLIKGFSNSVSTRSQSKRYF